MRRLHSLIELIQSGNLYCAQHSSQAITGGVAAFEVTGTLDRLTMANVVRSNTPLS
jgi:hypothetical protein